MAESYTPSPYVTSSQILFSNINPEVPLFFLYGFFSLAVLESTLSTDVPAHWYSVSSLLRFSHVYYNFGFIFDHIAANEK